MKTPLSSLFFLPLVCVVFFSSCSKDTIIASGDLVEKEHSITGITSIEVGSGIDLIYTESDIETFSVRASDNVIDHIDIKINGPKVSCTVESGYIIKGTNTMEIIVSGPRLGEVSASGGSDFYSTNYIDEAFFVTNLSGGSNAELSIKAENITINASGGGKINLKGTSNFLKFISSGGCSLKDYDMITKNLSVESSGGSKVYLTVNEELDINATGGSEIYYKGTGVINSIVTSGGSKVVHVD